MKHRVISYGYGYGGEIYEQNILNAGIYVFCHQQQQPELFLLVFFPELFIFYLFVNCFQ